MVSYIQGQWSEMVECDEIEGFGMWKILLIYEPSTGYLHLYKDIES